MAEALAIVGEAGIHGLEYNGLLSAWCSSRRFKSNRFRFSPVPAHAFTGEEFEKYMLLAWRFGLVERSKYKEVEWQSGLDKSSYQVEDEIVSLTREGWEFVEFHGRPTMHRWGSWFVENIPRLVTSILVSAATAWLLIEFGLKSN
ncbi:hypothetical protein K3723_02535 [Leisingera caerulea]|uniref:hypothetical protein n=1 Tax=Leisingera caerulea TaxID=506591 RepID=UPI0021A441A0|nr:hypothetical protein [Leisingera caerulea]UWQ63195.1 hypothetical protein K3723_02535 [Leisingera caerulea]